MTYEFPQDRRDFFEVLDHTDLVPLTVATDVESCPVIEQTSEQDDGFVIALALTMAVVTGYVAGYFMGALKNVLR